MRLLFCCGLLLCCSAGFGQYTIPSLSRPYAAMPPTSDIVFLRLRLGEPQGQFAAAQLVLLGEPGLKALLIGSKHPDHLTRLDATTGLVASGEPAALFRLGELLGDPSYDVAGEARHGLALYRGRAFDALVRAARNDNPQGALAASYMLYSMPGGQQAILAIAADPKARARATALGIWSGDPRSLSIAVDALDDPRGDVRKAAARKILTSPDRQGKTAAVNLLLRKGVEARFAMAGSSFAASAGWQLSTDPSPQVRAEFATNIVRHLYWEQDASIKRRYFHFIAKLSNDPNALVTDALLETLRQFVDDTGKWRNAQPLPTMEADDSARIWAGLSRFLTGQKRNVAATQLAYFGSGKSFKVLIEMTTSPDPQVQWNAIMAFGNLRERRAVPRLIKLLPNGNLREMTATALGRIGDKQAVPALVGVLENDYSTGVGMAAAIALQKIGDPSAIPGLRRVIDTKPVPLDFKAKYEEILKELEH